MNKYKYKLKEDPLKVGKKTFDKDVESTVTDIDKDTGSITWDIKKLPSITTVFNKLKELDQFLETLDRDTEDTVIDDIHEEITEIFNRYRTHIRKNYPEAYKRINEISISTGAGSYLSKTMPLVKKKFKYKLKEEPVSSLDIFQKKRINKFDELEGNLINLKKKLRQGKLSTIRYYNENPKTWEVFIGTDLIEDYFKDIETLLSNNN